jgi:hypothetical protein
MSEERHQQRQQRLKEQVDARVAAAQDERGIIIVLPATGKVKPPPRLVQQPVQWVMVRKWVLFSLLKVNGLTESVICWSRTASNFR